MNDICVIGCGWLGLPTARSFVNSGKTVGGSTTGTGKLASLAVAGIDPFIYRLGEGLESTIPQVKTYIVNIPPSSVDNYDKHLESLIGYINSLEARLIFCSTTSVYPDVDQKFAENGHAPESLLNMAVPDEARHGTRRSTLLRAEMIAEQVPGCTILRLAGLYGAGRHPITYLSGRTALKSPHAPVNLVHLTDVVATLTRVVESGQSPSIMNVVSGQHPSRRDYYEHIARQKGLPLPGFDETDLSGGKTIDNTRLAEFLGYDPPLRDPD